MNQPEDVDYLVIVQCDIVMQQRKRTRNRIYKKSVILSATGSHNQMERFRTIVCTLFVITIALVSVSFAPAASRSDAELQQIRDGFEARRDAMLQQLAGTPFKPAAKRPPLKPGRGQYTRHYSYSVTDFVTKSFLLEEQLNAANTALRENCRFYVDNKLERNDRDSFYWAADVVCRLVEFFGAGGSIAAGRMDPATEQMVLEMAWLYCKDNSRLEDADEAKSKTWHINESENHHLQQFSTAWQFSKFLKDAPDYKNRRYDDGHTPAEHFDAWTRYTNEFLLERARKGLFVEIANPGYGFQSLKCIYAFYDFAEDATLRRRAGYLLDLFWATWAEEQLGGVRGGGKTRIYQELNSQIQVNDRLADLAWYYMGLGAGSPPRGNTFSMITSKYRLPLVVIDIALDPAGRGVYETKQRRMGLVEDGYYTPPNYRMRTDRGGIFRYSYCTPTFIMGTLIHDARPLENWAMISSQNRWHGVIFAGNNNSRIYPQCRAKSERRTYNQQWSVQSKGTLIAQKLAGDRFSRNAKEMRVWFAKDLLTDRQERAGWVFVEATGAYAAVRPVKGTYQWQPVEGRAQGDWLCCGEERTPVIVEVAQKIDFASYQAFQTAVLELPLEFQNDRLAYTGLGGDEFTFDAAYNKRPTVNGQTVDLAPPAVLDSPFVQSKWNSGLIVIQKDDRRTVLDFNTP